MHVELSGVGFDVIPSARLTEYLATTEGRALSERDVLYLALNEHDDGDVLSPFLIWCIRGKWSWDNRDVPQGGS